MRNFYFFVKILKKFISTIFKKICSFLYISIYYIFLFVLILLKFLTRKRKIKVSTKSHVSKIHYLMRFAVDCSVFQKQHLTIIIGRLKRPTKTEGKEQSLCRK